MQISVLLFIMWMWASYMIFLLILHPQPCGRWKIVFTSPQSVWGNMAQLCLWIQPCQPLWRWMKGWQLRSPLSFSWPQDSDITPASLPPLSSILIFLFLSLFYLWLPGPHNCVSSAEGGLKEVIWALPCTQQPECSSICGLRAFLWINYTCVAFLSLPASLLLLTGSCYLSVEVSAG